MPQFIIKLHDDKENKDYFLMWSTIVDAPITFGMSLKEFQEYYKYEYGASGMEKLPERLARVEQSGCSAREPSDSLDELLKFNRAGRNEKNLNKEGILEHYCRNPAEWLKIK